MRILMWDVHGGYTDALTRGQHEYCFLRDDSPAALGLGGKGLVRFGPELPERLREVTIEEVRDRPPEVVLAQRPEEAQKIGELLRCEPGRDVGAVYLEHNTPKAQVPDTRHPLDDNHWLLVHVTHFNQLFWDCGSTRTVVIEHGLPDPGCRYTGALPHLAFVVNEPVRRWRTTGTDLLTRFGEVPVDTFGIDGELLPRALEPSAQVRFCGNLGSAELDGALAERRAYLHLTRWTSLGLSLIQAMLLGLPVLVLETTEAARAVPRSAGARSTDVAELVRAAAHLTLDLEDATECGRRARAHALQRYGLERFLADWDRVFEQVAAGRPVSA